jgi:hypothetical protein
VTAVVSLCPVGEQDEETILARIPHWLEVRLADDDDPAENQNLDFVLHDTVTAVEQLRAVRRDRPGGLIHEYSRAQEGQSQRRR